MRSLKAAPGGHALGSSIGSNVTVGHGAVLHGVTVEDEAFIGIGAVLQEGVKVPSCPFLVPSESNRRRRIPSPGMPTALPHAALTSAQSCLTASCRASDNAAPQPCFGDLLPAARGIPGAQKL